MGYDEGSQGTGLGLGRGKWGPEGKEFKEAAESEACRVRCHREVLDWPPRFGLSCWPLPWLRKD